ncbi:MAG: Spy/CpxP family protein refolding chaperone [Gemmatimonadaceae bacterium]
MRKSILVGFGLALTVAGTALAQQPQDGQRARRGGERAGKMEGRRGGPDGLLLKDITLTEQQRAQIAQLRKTQRAEMQANREKNRSQFEELRAARQRGDTVAVRKAFETRRVAMQQAREQHIAAIRTVLTVEQRVQFNKNVAELKTRTAQRAERVGKGERGRRGPRGGARGPGGR